MTCRTITWCGVLCALLACSALTACHNRLTGRPAWSVSQIHPAYPEQAYLSGGASAENREQAERLARQRLSNKLAAQLTALSSLGPAPEPTELLGAEEDIPIVVNWSSQDGSRHAALAAVAREDLGRGLRRQEQSLAQELGGLLDEAAELQDKLPYSALLKLVAAEILERRMARSSRLRQALEAGTPPSHDVELVRTDAAALAFKKWLGSLNLTLIRGQAQKARAGRRLDKPLVVAVEWVDQQIPRPVARMPLRLEIDAPGAETESLRSEQNGWVTASPMLPEGSQGKPQVAFLLDAARILLDAGLAPGVADEARLVEALESVRLELKLEVPAVDMPRCVVLIAESQEGDFVRAPVTDHELGRLLSDWGCDVLRKDELELKLPDPPTEAAIVRALQGKVRYAVIGEAASVLSRELRENFVFSEAWGRMSLYRAADGRELKRFESKLSSPGTSAKNAGTRALKKLSAKAYQAFLPLLEGGPETP